jgi:DedD protein
MDKVLKRRLIGASILIALAVIFVPMLLVDPDAVDDGGARDRVDVPPMPDTARDVRRIPLNPESPDEAGQRARSSPADDSRVARSPDDDAEVRPDPDAEIVLRPELESAEVPPAEPVDAETDAAQAEPGDIESDASGSDDEALAEAGGDAADGGPDPDPRDPAPATEPTGAAGAETVSMGDYVVQVASFGSDQAAGRIRARLEALGHIVRRDEIVRGQTMLYRLRTGPYPSREAAETALEQIAATVDGVDPIVRSLEELAGVGNEAGFAVQVGSFVGQDNAESETSRLAELGFDSFRFSEQIGERLIWRVMVGPVDDRAAAERLKDRLAEQAGVEGLVVSHP